MGSLTANPLNVGTENEPEVLGVDQKRLLEDCKICIKSIMAAYPYGADSNKIEKDYNAIVGQQLPYKELGFASAHQFLKTITDILGLMQDVRGNTYFVLSNIQKIEHIRELVTRQKKRERPDSYRETEKPIKNVINPIKFSTFPNREEPKLIKNTTSLRQSLPSPAKTDQENASSPIVHLSHKATFSSAHRLHSNRLNQTTNQSLYGKCNNLNGHGHNYKVKVTLKGPVTEKTGILISPRVLREVVESILQEFDYSFIDKDIPYFRDQRVVSSAENIAVYIFDRIRAKLLVPELLESVKLEETEGHSVVYFGHKS